MLLDLGPFGQANALSTVFIGIGVLTLSYCLYYLGRALVSIFVLPGKPLSTFGPKGSWAVITGASDGLGKEFASQLARNGFNLILASRTKSKLEDVAAGIKGKTPDVKIETIAIDFAKATDGDYKDLAALFQGKRIAVLINNVGQSHSIPVPFAETEKQEMENIININCHATLRVTQLVLPNMLPNKKGLILTMGSMAGFAPTPFLATYSGSKSFLQHWSTALASELETEGITVHFVQAYLITSAMSKVRRPTWLVPNERNFVKAALSKIGRGGGSMNYAYSGTPYWSHAIITWLIIVISGPMAHFFLGINRKFHVDIRKRALRKLEREKQQGKKTS